jgi:hypothetical protein
MGKITEYGTMSQTRNETCDQFCAISAGIPKGASASVPIMSV